MRYLALSLPALAWLACADATATDISTTTNSTTGSGGAPTTTSGEGASTTDTGGRGGAGGGAGGGGGGASATGGGGASGACVTCDAPATAGTAQNAALIEASGLAASVEHPGSLYAHNDSGDIARFFALGADGADLGVYNLTGASATDWEDMARGPCANKANSCLYFGDIGDNNENRQSYTLYRTPEPATLAAGSHDVTFETFHFTYPDGPHNAETLLVHPTTGAVFIVTKKMRGSRLYSFPLPLNPATTATLVSLGDVNVPGLMPLVTGGDIRPSGDGVAIRTYTSIYFYPIANGTPIEAAMAVTPCDLPAPMEPQGEAIAWTADGTGLRTISEGASPVIHSLGCR